MYPTSSFKNQYVDIFVSHGLSASINTPTHKAGNTLDNILLENVSHFNDFVVINDISLSDHYPILFNCLISGSLLKSTSLASSYCFNSAKQISSFILSLPNFTFTGFASSTNSDSFYSHLKFIIPQSFTQKTKNSLE